jgi:hypothetical protein
MVNFDQDCPYPTSLNPHLVDGVIPKPRVFTSEARDLLAIGACHKIPFRR